MVRQAASRRRETRHDFHGGMRRAATPEVLPQPSRLQRAGLRISLSRALSCRLLQSTNSMASQPKAFVAAITLGVSSKSIGFSPGDRLRTRAMFAKYSAVGLRWPIRAE